MAEAFVFFTEVYHMAYPKIGPTHQITLSTDLGGYRETPRINHMDISKGRSSLQLRLSAQEADDVGFTL
jgi:hypothetical protein